MESQSMITVVNGVSSVSTMGLPLVTSSTTTGGVSIIASNHNSSDDIINNHNHTTSSSIIVSNTETSSPRERRKSVRFSRFEKVYYTHSPGNYDRSPIDLEFPRQSKKTAMKSIPMPSMPIIPASAPSLNHHYHHHHHHHHHHAHGMMGSIIIQHPTNLYTSQPIIGN